MNSFRVIGFGIVIALALAACGASSGEVKAARTAHYTGDKMALFTAMKTAVEGKYKLDKVDETTLGLQTLGRWYNPEGQIAAEGNTTGDYKSGYKTPYPDKSINIVYAVGLKQDGDAWVVQVKPVLNRYHAGSPQPEPLTEDDVSLPGWVGGKTDALAMDIHDALKQYEVKGVPQSVPAGPPGGNTAAPAAGSAAGSAATPASSATPAP
jgi:hypothetical protein